MSDVGSLLSRVGDGLFQQAFVVGELGAAEETMRSTIGCTEFVNLPASDLEYELRGECARAALAIGFARSGNVQVELIQPVRGASLHAEFLAAHGPGAHHLGFLVDDLHSVVALAEDAGFPKLMGARFGSLEFCYLDTWDAIGLYTELVQDPDGMMWSLMPWR